MVVSENNENTLSRVVGFFGTVCGSQMIEAAEQLTWFCFGIFGGLPLVVALTVWQGVKQVINEGSTLGD
jgi:hypothetical protein